MLEKEVIEALLQLKDDEGAIFATLYSNPFNQEGAIGANFEIDERFKEVYDDYLFDMLRTNEMVNRLLKDKIESDLAKEGVPFTELTQYVLIASQGKFYIIMRCPYLSENMNELLKSNKFKDVEEIITNFNELSENLSNSLNNAIDKYLEKNDN